MQLNVSAAAKEGAKESLRNVIVTNTVQYYTTGLNDMNRHFVQMHFTLFLPPYN